jgi:hypothetical protein
MVEDPDGIFWLVPDWELVGQVLSQFTRTVVEPPPATLARVDYDIPIRVENGTNNQGLAARVAAQLRDYGFTNVTFAPATAPGYYPTTTIVDHSGNLTTAAVAAAVIGVEGTIIDQQFTGVALLPSPSPPTAAAEPTATANAATPSAGDQAPDGASPVAATPTGEAVASAEAAAATAAPALAEQVGIVIVLGEDAPDPALYAEPGA